MRAGVRVVVALEHWLDRYMFSSAGQHGTRLRLHVGQDVHRTRGVQVALDGTRPWVEETLNTAHTVRGRVGHTHAVDMVCACGVLATNVHDLHLVAITARQLPGQLHQNHHLVDARATDQQTIGREPIHVGP